MIDKTKQLNMKKLYCLTAALLLSGAALRAQSVAPPSGAPCSTFENPSPQGNWNTTFCTAKYVDTNPLDGSQCVTLYDGSGGSWYENKTDYKSIGKLYPDQCLCFDYALVNDGGSGMPFYPTIYISDGVNTIAFVSATAVTPGSGWIHVCAPIQHCSGAVLPANADGHWVNVTGSGCADFNTVLDNSMIVSFPTDITSCPCEVMMIDNVCVKKCTNCQSRFTLSANMHSDGTASADVFLDSTDPSADYRVDWGDGAVTTPYVSHVYSAPGSYVVCVSEYIGDVLICRSCMTFCYSEQTTRYSGVNPGGGDGGGEVGGANPVGRSGASSNTVIKRNVYDNKFSVEGFAVFPNPSKDYTEVQFSLLEKTQVTVKIMDMVGRVVAETTGTYDRDTQKVKLNTDKLATGVYNVEINVGGNISTQKLSISK